MVTFDLSRKAEKRYKKNGYKYHMLLTILIYLSRKLY